MTEHPVEIQTATRADDRRAVEDAAVRLRDALGAVFTDAKPTVWIVASTDPVRLRVTSYQPQRRADVVAAVQKVAGAFPRIGLMVLDE